MIYIMPHTNQVLIPNLSFSNKLFVFSPLVVSAGMRSEVKLVAKITIKLKELSTKRDNCFNIQSTKFKKLKKKQDFVIPCVYSSPVHDYACVFAGAFNMEINCEFQIKKKKKKTEKRKKKNKNSCELHTNQVAFYGISCQINCETFSNRIQK